MNCATWSASPLTSFTSITATGIWKTLRSLRSFAADKKMNVGLEHYLVVSVLLFALGLLGVITRRNLLVIYMSLELMLNSANLALVAFSRFTDNLISQVFVFFIITVAAAEVA